MILALRTDSPDATILMFEAGGRELDRLTWTAGRQLSQQLLPQIKQLLRKHRSDWGSLTGIVVWRGPGSFTGLRIGIAVANTMAYSLDIPIVGSTGDGWIDDGLRDLKSAQPGLFVRPDYGAEPNISKPKK